MSRINSQSLVWETASTPTLNSGWSASGGNSIFLPTIRRNLSTKQAIVSCNLAKNNTTLDSPFTVPSGYRPALATYGSFFVQNLQGIYLGLVFIGTPGTVELYLPVGTTLTSNPAQVGLTISYLLP